MGDMVMRKPRDALSDLVMASGTRPHVTKIIREVAGSNERRPGA
jgi:hypothetical protein